MRKVTISAFVQWIIPEAGGPDVIPKVGARPMLRWQRHVDHWVSLASSGQIVEYGPEKDLRCGAIEIRLLNSESVMDDWLTPGELIELLDGFQVIGVGCIMGVDRSK
jgi:hypothetical protein